MKTTKARHLKWEVRFSHKMKIVKMWYIQWYTQFQYLTVSRMLRYFTLKKQDENTIFISQSTNKVKYEYYHSSLLLYSETWSNIQLHAQSRSECVWSHASVPHDGAVVALYLLRDLICSVSAPHPYHSLTTHDPRCPQTYSVLHSSIC